MAATVHETAEVDAGVELGDGTRVWHWAQLRAGATVGRDCVIGKGAYIGVDVRIGDRVKVQNQASLFRGVTVEDWAFIGPHACITNDRVPRSTQPDGSPKDERDWECIPTRVGRGASIGAGAIIRCGVDIAPWSMVGAGAVVVGDVRPHEIVVGNPARSIGFACRCGRRVPDAPEKPCTDCQTRGYQWD